MGAGRSPEEPGGSCRGRGVSLTVRRRRGQTGGSESEPALWIATFPARRLRHSRTLLVDSGWTRGTYAER